MALDGPCPVPAGSGFVDVALFGGRVSLVPRWAAGRALEAWSSSRAHLLSFAGQAAVSLASFLTTFLLGRFASPGELGLYASGASVLILLLQCVDPLFGRPFVVPRFHRTRQEGGYA